MNLSKIIYWAERKYDERPAVITADGKLSYKQLRLKMEKYIRFFSILGLDRGRPVIVRLPNIPEFIFTTMALNCLGIPVVLVSDSITPFELGYIISDSNAQLVISRALDETYSKSVLLLINRSIGFIDIDRPSHINSSCAFNEYIESLRPQTGMHPAPCSIIIYTSGENGFLRGACLSYSNLMSSILVSREYMYLTPGDVCLPLLPFYHAYGFSSTLLSGFLEGAVVVLPDRYAVGHIFECIEKYSVNRIQSVPMFFYSLFNHRKLGKANLSSLKNCISGGSPIDPEFQSMVYDRFKIYISQGYGFTEACAAVAFNTFDDEIIFGSCGRLLPIFSSKIVDDDGKELGMHEKGELYVKGPAVISNYIGKFCQCRDRWDHEGWFRTGDYFTVDELGNHYFKGLKKDMLLVGGNNVYPREVERIIFAIGGVVSVSVFRSGQTNKGSDIAGAKIVLSRGTDIEEIKKSMSEYLSPYKMPLNIEWVYE